MTWGAKGESASRLVSIGAARTAKASSEGWRLRLRPNSPQGKNTFDKVIQRSSFPLSKVL
jgi:hypothetical protein